jgi:SNF2 family DNA or RNA helicase
MAEIHRFSSRRQRLDQSFLANRLKGAKSYKRIAGYFRSSIFELVGEEIANIPHVQIVCNSELDAADEAIIEEIKRVAERVEICFAETTSTELPAAALAESPIYRGEEQLQPWQRACVAMFLKHRETYGKARLLLADEVGLGKTLSLAASAMLAVLLDDGPVLILCPATLTLQWQVELKDKLGIPSAVWLSAKKVWVDEHGHVIKTRGPEDIGRCPFRIAIVSTGLIIHDSDERRLLLERKFGTVVLDETHKARRRGVLGEQRGEPNNLLAFMLGIGPRTKNLLLGTATPIQTEVSELWDLMCILNTGRILCSGAKCSAAGWTGTRRFR